MRHAGRSPPRPWPSRPRPGRRGGTDRAGPDVRDGRVDGGLGTPSAAYGYDLAALPDGGVVVAGYLTERHGRLRREVGPSGPSTRPSVCAAWTTSPASSGPPGSQSSPTARSSSSATPRRTTTARSGGSSRGSAGPRLQWRRLREHRQRRQRAAPDVAIAPDGRIVVVGQTTAGGGRDGRRTGSPPMAAWTQPSRATAPSGSAGRAVTRPRPSRCSRTARCVVTGFDTRPRR